MAEALARKIRPVRRSVQKRGGIRSKCAVHVERDVSPLLNASAQLAGAVRDGRRRSLTRDFQKQEPRLFATWWTTYNPVDYSEEQFPGNSSSSISLVCCFALCKKKLFLAIGSQSQCSSLEVEEQILAKTISLPPSFSHCKVLIPPTRVFLLQIRKHPPPLRPLLPLPSLPHPLPPRHRKLLLTLLLFSPPSFLNALKCLCHLPLLSLRRPR